MSQPRVLIASDTYCLSHIFLKAEASARSFPKCYRLKLQGVKNQIVCNFPWMSYTFMGKFECLASGIIKWTIWNRISRHCRVQRGRELSASPFLSRCGHTHREFVLPFPGWEFWSPECFAEIHGYSWAGVVWGRQGQEGKTICSSSLSKE